jgi:hypothetical protein
MPYSGIASDGGAAWAIGQLGHISNGNPVWVLAGNTLSVELWHWPLTLGSFQAVELATATQFPGIRFQASGKYIGYLGGTVVTSATVFAVASWHHLVLTYDHVTLKLYVDGVLEASAALAFTAIGNYGLYLLADSAGANWGTGAVCEVAVYSTLLSATNVAAHFAARSNPSNALVFAGGGAFAGGTGSSTPLSSDTAAILASVRKVY